jgi:hypothetical protein
MWRAHVDADQTQSTIARHDAAACIYTIVDSNAVVAEDVLNLLWKATARPKLMIEERNQSENQNLSVAANA